MRLNDPIDLSPPTEMSQLYRLPVMPSSPWKVAPSTAYSQLDYSPIFDALHAAETAYKYGEGIEEGQTGLHADKLWAHMGEANHNMKLCSQIIGLLGGIPVRMMTEGDMYGMYRLLGPKEFTKGRWSMVLKDAMIKAPEQQLLLSTSEIRAHHRALFEQPEVQ